MKHAKMALATLIVTAVLGVSGCSAMLERN